MMSVKTALYAGSFDPVTYGHIDIIKRACQIFPQLVVAVAANIEKRPIFSPAERVALLESMVSELPNVKVISYEGMTVDYAKAIGAHVLIRGLRNHLDFEGEFQMAHTNRSFAPDIDTLFLPCSIQWSFVSSRLIRESAALGGDITPFVPEHVARLLRQKLNLPAPSHSSAASNSSTPMPTRHHT